METNPKLSSTYKTLRHMESVRNFIGTCIKELLERGEQHDQSKLQSPELEIFDKYTPILRETTYNSPEYKESMKLVKQATDHHYSVNRHHPEHFPNGINDMTLIDILEMLCDWKAASLRHNDGNILKSIEVNVKKYKINKQLAQVLMNTAVWMDSKNTDHKAEES